MSKKDLIRQYLRNRPELTGAEIGRLCNCSPGYVSMVRLVPKQIQRPKTFKSSAKFYKNEECPRVTTKISAWYTDEFGNACRTIEGVAA